MNVLITKFENEMNEHNIKMGTAILENKTNAKKIQKAGR